MASKKATRDGEYLSLYWEMEPPYEVVRGHVSHAVAIDAVHYEGIEMTLDNAESRHAYGRWEWSQDFQRAEFDRVFQDHADPGRGKFKVTLVTWK